LNQEEEKKAAQEIEKYLELLEPILFQSDVEIYFNFNNHAKMYSTDSYIYVGSQNFSIGSYYNYELGVLLKNENHIAEKIVKELISDKKNTVRFFGIETEKLKKFLQNKCEEIEDIIQQINYEIDYELDGYSYLQEVKANFFELEKILYTIENIVEEMKTELKKTEKNANLYSLDFIKSIKKELNIIQNNISFFIITISSKGEFSDIYYNFNSEIFESIDAVDEESLSKFMSNAVQSGLNYCEEIKNKYILKIEERIYNLKNSINSFKKLTNSIEKITSNRELIDNTSN
jgi:hypothetical protein